MSNEIHTGKLPVNLTSHTSTKQSKLSSQGAEQAAKKPEQPVTGDTVSITADVSRLQEIENMLGSIPPVNNALVSEISTMIANGTLEMDLNRTASRLIEMESGVPASDNTKK
ncbi:MAG: flagellar biosynthesis anti-sigma factor FlgM [Gammaproteobacteria bacterium]